MSESRAKLEQILELILSEDTKKAEQLLHEYVVDKARREYERVLESDDEEDEIDRTGDLEDEVAMDDEIDAEETGDDEEGDDEDAEFDFDGDGEMDAHEEEHEDVEDRVEDLEAELEELQREFEQLISGEGEEDEDFGDEDDLMPEEEPEMDADDGDEEGGFLDDEEDDEMEEGFMEATKLQDKAKIQHDKAGGLPGSEDDSKNNKSSFTKVPKKTAHGGDNSKPKGMMSSKGGQGKMNHGGKVKDHTPEDNVDVKPKKSSMQHRAR